MVDSKNFGTVAVFLGCVTISTFFVICPLGGYSYFKDSERLDTCVNQAVDVGLSKHEAYALCFPVHQTEVQMMNATFIVMILFVSFILFIGGMTSFIFYALINFKDGMFHVDTINIESTAPLPIIDPLCDAVQGLKDVTHATYSQQDFVSP